MNFKKFYLILFVFALSFTNVNSIEPEIFVESTIKKATSILSNNSSKESKIKQLKTVAKETVDINGIGLYTLGPVRNSLDTTQKEKYIKLRTNPLLPYVVAPVLRAFIIKTVNFHM